MQEFNPHNGVLSRIYFIVFTPKDVCNYPSDIKNCLFSLYGYTRAHFSHPYCTKRSWINYADCMLSRKLFIETFVWGFSLLEFLVSIDRDFLTLMHQFHLVWLYTELKLINISYPVYLLSEWSCSWMGLGHETRLLCTGKIMDCCLVILLGQLFFYCTLDFRWTDKSFAYRHISITFNKISLLFF